MATPLDIQVTARKVLADGTGETPYWLAASTAAVQGSGGGGGGSTTWAQLVAKPSLIIDPVTGQGADFDANTTGTVSGGFIEAITTVANSSALSTNQRELCVMPGNIVTSVPVPVTAFYLVLRGSGMEASGLKANFNPSSTGGFYPSPYNGQNLLYWPNVGSPKTQAIGDGTYVGHLNFNLNSKSFGYGVVVGVPGGFHPDPAAAAALFEHCITSAASNTTVGFCASGVEDMLSLQCSFASAATGAGPQGSPTGVYGVEWIVYDGTFKLIGGNNGCMNIQGSHPNILDSVWAQLTIGNVYTASSLTEVTGVGGNGYPSNSDASAITPVVYVVSGSPLICTLSTKTCNMSLTTSYATAYSGLIGGPGASTLYYVDDASYLDANTNNQPLFGLQSFGGSMASGYADLRSTANVGVIGNFLGTGSFINGTVIQRLNPPITSYLSNGFVRPVGPITAPFGTAYATWQANSTVPVSAPGLSSGSATPASGTSYYVAFTPQMHYWSGGSGVTVSVNGTALPSGVPSVQLYIGNTIQYTYTTAPTVFVLGN